MPSSKALTHTLHQSRRGRAAPLACLPAPRLQRPRWEPHALICLHQPAPRAVARRGDICYDLSPVIAALARGLGQTQKQTQCCAGTQSGMHIPEHRHNLTALPEPNRGTMATVTQGVCRASASAGASALRDIYLYCYAACFHRRRPCCLCRGRGVYPNRASCEAGHTASGKAVGLRGAREGLA